MLFLIPRYPPPIVGGLERQAQELARALSRRGVPVQVISGCTMPGQRSSVEEGVPVHRLADVPGMLGPLVRAAAIAFRMWVLRRDYAVVHLHNLSWFAVPALLTARLLGRPVLAKLPGAGPHCGIPRQVARPCGRLWLKVFLRADAVAALSDESVAEVRAVGFPPERVFRATNGVDTERFRPTSASRPDGDPPLVVYVGRFSAEKGVRDLLEAWPLVLARVPARLELYGAGPLESELRARVCALGLEGSVAFRGTTDDVAGVLGGADLFALPSHSEGNSNALLEAMACGVPVVATRTGGTPMLLGMAGAAELVPPADPAALGECMADLLADPGRRAALGAALLARVRAHFDMEAVAAAYQRAYHCLAEGEVSRIGSLSPPPFQS